MGSMYPLSLHYTKQHLYTIYRGFLSIQACAAGYVLTYLTSAASAYCIYNTVHTAKGTANTGRWQAMCSLSFWPVPHGLLCEECHSYLLHSTNFNRDMVFTLNPHGTLPWTLNKGEPLKNVVWKDQWQATWCVMINCLTAPTCPPESVLRQGTTDNPTQPAVPSAVCTRTVESIFCNINTICRHNIHHINL
jgi:hypothetical protein